MLSLSVEIRKKIGKRIRQLRKQGKLPAVLYGPKLKTLPLEVNLKEFEKVYQEAGESSIIKLKIRDEESKIKEFQVLIHDIQLDPLKEKPLHVDFFQPSLKEEIVVSVPLVFEGLSLAIKELGGTLVKNIQEVEVKALPQNLPHEIRVNIDSLKTLEDEILIKDLKVGEGIKVLKKPEEVVAFVSPLEKVEEELEKPVEEKVEEVEKVKEKEEKEREEVEEKSK